MTLYTSSVSLTPDYNPKSQNKWLIWSYRERNNTARLQNYHTATHNPHDGKLEPLYSLKTHEAIRDFPKSVVDMPRSEAEIDALLQALEVECRGNVEEKKVVLGTAIGVE